MFIKANNLTSDEILHQVEELSSLASDLNITMSQLALAWCLRLDAVSSVICGATRIEQIDENIEASGISLEDDVIAKIESLLKVKVTH